MSPASCAVVTNPLAQTLILYSSHDLPKALSATINFVFFLPFVYNSDKNLVLICDCSSISPWLPDLIPVAHF